MQYPSRSVVQPYAHSLSHKLILAPLRNARIYVYTRETEKRGENAQKREREKVDGLPIKYKYLGIANNLSGTIRASPRAFWLRSKISRIGQFCAVSMESRATIAQSAPAISDLQREAGILGGGSCTK